MPSLTPPRARTLALSVAGWTLLAVARAAARITAQPRPPAEMAVMVGRTLLVSVPWMLATPWLIDLAGRIGRGRRWQARVAEHALVALGCTIVDSVWSMVALRWTGQPITVGPALWFLGRLDQSLFLYLCLVAIGAAARHRRRLDGALVARARLESQLLHARLHVLSLQLHPHFLYNTLNAVSELVHRDARAARDTMANLAELLRRTLGPGGAQEHPLRDELSLLEPYLRIQRTRFTNLTVTVTADASALDAAVPRLVLQPLVENAIRHGTARRSGPGQVAVRGQVAGERLLLEVEDDGPGAGAAEPREGIGLGNTRARLRELYGPHARLTLAPAGERGTVARVDCPRRAAPHPDPAEAAPTEHASEGGEARPLGPRRLGLLLLGGWLAVALLGAHEDYLAGHLLGTPDPFLAVLRPRLAEGLIWLGLSPLVLWLSARLARAGVGWVALAGIHLAGAAVISAAHLGLTLRFVSPGLGPSLVATVLVVDLALYAALAAAAHAWTIAHEAVAAQANAARLDGELAAARLDLLRWRLRPELLFRALDAIGELAAADPDRADELTGRLGELLRAMLPTRSDDVVPLRAEIDFLHAHGDVCRAIGFHAPELTITLEPGADRMPVPAMLLQPLAELVTGSAGGSVVVEGAVRAGALLLNIRGRGATRSSVESLELELRRRLTRQFGDDCGLDVTRAGSGNVASLAIPAGAGWRAVA